MKKDILTTAFLDIRGKLHRIAMRLLHDEEDAMDAMQDTFEKLWSRDEVESDDEARNKLIRVLHNTCIDKIRGRHTVPLESDSSFSDLGYEVPYDEMTEYEHLILTGLTEKQKQIFMMVTHECMEYDCIASTLDMTVEAVRMNMSRARKRIRENIKIIDR